jgi:hypothetical protein
MKDSEMDLLRDSLINFELGAGLLRQLDQATLQKIQNVAQEAMSDVLRLNRFLADNASLLSKIAGTMDEMSSRSEREARELAEMERASLLLMTARFRGTR